MKEKIRLIRLIEREFVEWQKVMKEYPIDVDKRTELETNIRAYSNEYEELTGEKYRRTNHYA